MSYTCIRPMKVQNANGVVEMRAPGDPVPEAASWPNPALWIKRGFIQADDHATVLESGYTRDRLLPMREATEADKKRGTGSPVPQRGKPLPGHAAKGDDTGDADGDAGGDDLSELMSLTRSDLDALAEEHGIDAPGGMPNKEAVAKAIVAAGEAGGEE